MARNYHTLIREGYQKHKGGIFKIPEFTCWHLIVTGPKLIDELRKAPDSQFSFEDAVRETLHIEWTLGPSVAHNMYHVPLVRNQLTRNIGALFPEIRDEIVAAFSDIIPVADDWVKVPALKTMMQVVGRVSNRVFVGLPKCRDPDYIELNVQFTLDVVMGALLINFFPNFLKSFTGRYFTNVPKSIERGVKHLAPTIRERYEMMEKYGDKWEGKPNDMLQWLMDNAEGEEREIRALVLRILTINFAAIHTSSNSFAHSILTLAANPQWIQPMREEAEEVVSQDGWSKVSMQKMRRIDSFLKEVQRMIGIGDISMSRLAMQDFTFSDGTFVPKGSLVSAASGPMHQDEEFYEDAEIFNPWRFVDMREEEGEGTKHQMVSTSLEYVPFGHGRHACPGRFFAANELKAMMAHLVMNYDIKLEGKPQGPKQWASAIFPDPKSEIMFKKRDS
ncbi:hypothetical protein EW026_g5347 [Hermanssonia centrifuga]|uniref:Cytochrome P450 n=1 Tax=Hermanssonia centrifuga TaxID=98765 RepID=A0A4S4KED6_9APHY|nr:hypothetical protein EW026_g5347 [Hermanssonia centrifuga]